jgi:protein ImuB
MDRLVAVCCPLLQHEGERGEEARRFSLVLRAVDELCPWVEPVALGICTLPARGPSRFFGGDERVVDQLGLAVSTVLGATGPVQVGVADGLFAALLAARAGVVVAPGETRDFLAAWSLAVLRRPDLAVTLQRLGIHTLGQFAALPSRHVLARFGGEAVLCHRVARAEVGELPGVRDPSVVRRLREVRGELPEVTLQTGFFGGASAGDVRAAQAVARLQSRLGPEAVLAGRLDDGRDPAGRGHLVPWGSRPESRRHGGRSTGWPAAPWPGRLPPPSPVVVLTDPLAVDLVDRAGRPVQVSGSGLLSDAPARLSVAGGPWRPVRRWAGPWPASERWWSGRRHRARLQVVDGAESAVLLAAERGRWWLEGRYD